MTKEELKKEAIKYAVDYPSSCGKGYMHKDLRIAYLAGAEPREKQIQIDAEQIRALQRQNGELTDELTKKSDTNHQLVEQLAKLNERCSELETENAELKELLDCKNCCELEESECESCAEFGHFRCKGNAQLTKAKGIIKELLNSCFGYNSKTVNYEVKTNAEQFLKENA